MADFRFNFGGEAEESTPSPTAELCTAEPLEPAAEEFPSLQVPDDTGDWHTEEVELEGGYRLLKPGLEAVAAAAAALDVGALATDLVPGRYEGGAKLWECALDLAAFLRSPEAPQTRGARVLELGCGHGLPGCVAALQGASEVVFQDYNAPVLHRLTAPTVACNLARADSPLSPRLRFVSGDWGALADSDILPAAAFDLVLTADSIYSERSQPHLLRLILRSLAPGGIALVAAKSFYFGVGGCTAGFRAAAEAAGAQVSCALRVTDGASNVREVLLLRML